VGQAGSCDARLFYDELLKPGSTRVCLIAAAHGGHRTGVLIGATSLLKMYCLVRPWRLAAEPLAKVIDPPRSF